MPIAAVAANVSAFTTEAVSPPEKVTVSPTSNSSVVAVYFKTLFDKLTTVPVAPLTLLVNAVSYTHLTLPTKA